MKRISNSENANILVVGDLILDRYVYGEVTRISPEAPKQILSQNKIDERVGGAGNVANNIVAMGGNVTLIGLKGADEYGQTLENLLSQNQMLKTELVLKEEQTTVKTRFLSGHHYLLRVDQETITPITEKVKKEVISKFIYHIDRCDVLVLSDYNKGFLTIDLLEEMIAIAKKNKIIIVDPKKMDLTAYSGATIITPNCNEARQSTNIVVGTDEQAVKAANKIMDQTKVDTVLLTRGANGMTLLHNEKNGREVQHIKAVAQTVYDVSGAGDTVVAALTLGVLKNLDMVQVARTANIAAGIVVRKVGTSVVTLDEIEKEIDKSSIKEPNAKIISLSDLQKQRSIWKAAGKKVGFTNGCFDLIHPGHIKILEQSKKLCDYLVVGLNSDTSVKRLKGNQRPLQNQHSRAIILAAMSFVDWVVVFDEDTPLHLIEALTPDLLTKGSDYTIESVVGADFVLNYGGDVKLINLKEGVSTTQLIDNMQSIDEVSQHE